MPDVRAAYAVALIFMLLISTCSMVEARHTSPQIEKELPVLHQVSGDWHRLKKGEVIVDSNDSGESKFVVARILINETPHKVWRVLTNPFEFEGKISPRMKQVEVLHDSVDRSLLRCKVEVFPPIIPFISYTVESEYKPYEQIVFRRTDGSLKDFKGIWTLTSREDGLSTEVTYSMFVDPGIPVPQWIIRKAMRMELPKTLTAVRDRLNNGDTAYGASEKRTILAVDGVGQISQSGKESMTISPPLPIELSEEKAVGRKAKHKRGPSKPKQLSIRAEDI